MKLKNNRNWIWGLLLLLVAAFIVANQLGLFMPLSFGSIVAIIFAAIFLTNCIIHRSIIMLPFVVALTYIFLRNQYLVPDMSTWALLAAATLVSVGIGFLIPQKKGNANFSFGVFSDDSENWDEDWDDDEDGEQRRERARTKAGGAIDNNPSISVNFGGVSRYLYADNLETVSLACNFGGMEIYFDQAQLSPDGAKVHLNCMFGGIEL